MTRLSSSNQHNFPALLFIFLAWAAYAAFNVIHHEVWRDEVHSWAIAKASESFADVIARSDYEGHPSLWYLLLFVLKQFSRELDALKWFHFSIAAAAIGLLLWRGRFSLLEKALLASGYFFVYEYAAIARNYSIGLVCMFAFCIFYGNYSGDFVFFQKNKTLPILSKWWESFLIGKLLRQIVGIPIKKDLLNSHFYEKRNTAWGLAGCCGSLFLLAFTNLFGYLIGVVLGGLLAWQVFKKHSFKSWQLPLVLTVWLAATGLGALDIQPAKDCASAVGWKTDYDKERALLTGSNVWNAYVPIPLLRLQFWGFNILDGAKEPMDFWGIHIPNAFHASCALKTVLGFLFLFFAVRRLRRQPAILLCFLAANLLFLLMTYTKFAGSLRHHGHYFMVWIVCLWLARGEEKTDEGKGESVFFRVWWYFLLAANVCAGVIAAHHEKLYIFSPHEAAAKFLKAQPGFMDAPWICDLDFIAEGVAGILDKKVLMTSRDKWATYVTWDNPRTFCDHTCLIALARQWAKETGKDAWILTCDPVKPPLYINTPDLRFVEVFPSGIEYTEIYWIYRIVPRL